MRRYMVFKSTPGCLAEEYVDMFAARIDRVLGYPNAHAKSYADKGRPHPSKPWRLVVLDERAEPWLEDSERSLIVSFEDLKAGGWFSGGRP